MTNILTTIVVTGLLFLLTATLPLLTDAVGNFAGDLEGEIMAGLSCMTNVFNGGSGC